MNKVIEISFGYMTNTLKVPVLKQGRIFAITGYQKGQGNYTGRFPCFFCVCSEDTEIQEMVIKRSESLPVGALKRAELIEKFSPVLFRQRGKAKTVAEAWTKRKGGNQ